MPTEDWLEARGSDDTWVMKVKPPGSGDQDRPDARPPGRAGRGLLVVAGVVLAAAIWGGTEAGTIRDHFARPAYDTVSISTSASSPAHPPANLTDPWNNTWWGSGTSASGTTLDARFPHPVNLADVAIIPGAGPTVKDYQSEGNPRSMTMTLVSRSGARTTQTLQLPGSPGPRIFPVGGDDITQVHFTITSVSLAGGPDSQTAIADIEFFSR